MQQLTVFGEKEQIVQVEKLTPNNCKEYLRKRSEQLPKDAPIIVSCGLGTNSIAILVYLYAAKIKPDAIVFSDTGGEKPETYAYIEILQQWLKSINFPPLTIVKKAPRYGTGKRTRILVKANKHYKNIGLFALDAYLTAYQNIQQWMPITTLEEECIVLKKLPGKSFGNGQCSVDWKIEPVEKWLKEWMIEKSYWHRAGRGGKLITNGIKAKSLVGYHAAETKRLFNKDGTPKPLENDLVYRVYPLVEKGIHQQACEAFIKAVNLPVPVKSACFFCPSAPPSEVKRLKREHPDLFERGCYIEERGEMEGWLTTVKGLGRSFSWRNIDKLTPLEETLLNANQRPCKACME